MFVSKEHHPQLLDPACYSSQQQFEDEVARLFRPGWHAVALLSELAHDGAYRTFDLFGSPILLWRKDGQIHAYLNVCAHRYSMLTSECAGTCERLKCQYHGWEYDETGNVRKIPDARAFKPLEPGMLGLKKYHTETCGQLIFVSLADNPPSLREYLGSGYDLCRAWFNDQMHTAIVHDRIVEANWKLLVENALESYHTTEVHPRTFGAFPDEQDCEHALEPGETSLTVSYANERSFRRRLDEFGHRMVGAKPTHQYQHILHYPNLMFSRLSLYKWVECIIPLSPTRSRSIVRLVCYAGRGPGWLTRMRAFWVKQWAKSFLMRVGAEDAALLPHVQHGVSAVDRPKGGLISTREERIIHFQQYLLNKMADASCCQTCESAQAGSSVREQIELS
jgi:choline monooxygenase